jgi:hypothetical protein
MEELDKYIEQIKRKIKRLETKNKRPLKEEEIVMLVYTNLGEKIYFDVDFMLGNRKTREEIYKNNILNYKLDEIFQEKKITCRTASKIQEYVLKKLGINIRTESYDTQETKYAHTYNIITPKDGSELYKIDLQNDLRNIQFHTMTKKFGKSTVEKTYVISLQRQKEIHKIIEYITPEKPYTEEYAYLLKQDASQIDDIYERLDFVLENIEPFDNKNIKYWERAWKHKEILEFVFSKELIKKIINGVICYKTEEEKKQYLNCYFILKKGIPYVYLYDEKKYKYQKYDINEFAKKISEDNIQISQETKIPRLNNIMNNKTK